MSLSTTFRLSSSLLRRSLGQSRRFPLCRLLRHSVASDARFFSSRRNNGDSRIVPCMLHEELTESYYEYARAALLGMDFPDIRDGLKPANRRILFAMHEMEMSSEKPYTKCARVVGEVLGKFDPDKDDKTVYDSLVSMARNFSLRYPLIQGYGAFGSIDGHPAAAMRYTECRLDPFAESVLLSDLDQDTVEFLDNYDASLKEPAVLPAPLPTLLLNGAYGMELEELLEHMPAPDLPTGGIIKRDLGLLDAYQTGLGCVVLRGKTDVELLDAKTERSAVIISEIPYQTNKDTLVQKIADLVENKKLEGISEIRDESDRNGMRVVVELKRGWDPARVVDRLYRHTDLQSRFNCNMIGICNGYPKLMGLKGILQVFRCVEKRTRFKLSHAHAQQRYHIIERKKLTDETSSLTEQISELNHLLSSRANILKLIEQEAMELKDRFSSPRRSMLEDDDLDNM